MGAAIFLESPSNLALNFFPSLPLLSLFETVQTFNLLLHFRFLFSPNLQALKSSSSEILDATREIGEGVTVLNSPTRSSEKEPCDDVDIGGNVVSKYSGGHAGPSKRASADVELSPRRGTSVNVELLQRLSKLEDSLKIVLDYVKEEKIRRSMMKRKQEEKGKAHMDSSSHQPVQNLEVVQTLEDVAEVLEVAAASLDGEKKTQQVPIEEVVVPSDKVAQNEDLDEESAANVTQDEELTKAKADDVPGEQDAQGYTATKTETPKSK